MFEDLRHAWKDAVDNFWRELEEDAGVPGDDARRQLSVMRRELGSAESELHRLETEIARTRAAVADEQREQETCLRRQSLAEGVGDAQTAELAATFAARAAERVTVLQRKAEALEAEQELRTRDLSEMRSTLEKAAAALGPGAAGAAGVTGGFEGGRSSGGADEDLTLGEWHGTTDEEKLKRDAEFRRMRREAAEKAAEARLEELKKRMG